MNSDQSNSQLALAPLGAGDLIDRAVRFYRQNFWTFVWIAAPPIIIGTLISIGWTFLGRGLFSNGASGARDEKFLYYLFVWFGSLIIRLAETIATLSVMGGASRNFVRHLLFDEPLSFRETYRSLRQRVGGLIAASSILAILLGLIGAFIFYFGFAVAVLTVVLIFYTLSFSPFLSIIVSIAAGGAIVGGTIWLFFLIASRFAYVPQVMLVENQGVFAAVSRSTALASGNVKRFAALFLFTTAATYSALSLFYIPLGWYAYLQGIEIFSLNADDVPAWYEVAKQVVWQASFILLMPVWMIGLCLLYVDERVRHEGYDIELLAARRLGAIPAVPTDFVNPLQPALGSQTPPPSTATPPNNYKKNSSMTTLGLD